jgi:Mg2+ and Co2+ transporter CorA
MDYLLERLQKLDKEIEEAERALLHLNKQAGKKLQKISRLKDERKELSKEYRREDAV